MDAPSPLEGALKRTGVLTNQMADILDVFNMRLDTVETAVQPLHEYLQTVKLIYENMGATNVAIDNVLKKLDYVRKLPNQLNSAPLNLDDPIEPYTQLQIAHTTPLPTSYLKFHVLLRQLCLIIRDLYPMRMQVTQNAMNTLLRVGQESIDRLEKEAFLQVLETKTFAEQDPYMYNESKIERPEDNPLSYELGNDLRRIQNCFAHHYPYGMKEIQIIRYVYNILEEFSMFDYKDTDKDVTNFPSRQGVFKINVLNTYIGVRKSAVTQVFSEASNNQQNFYDVIIEIRNMEKRKQKMTFEKQFKQLTVSLYFLSRLLHREITLAGFILPRSLASGAFDEIIKGEISGILQSVQSLTALMCQSFKLDPCYWLKSLLDFYTLYRDAIYSMEMDIHSLVCMSLVETDQQIKRLIIDTMHHLTINGLEFVYACYLDQARLSLVFSGRQSSDAGFNSGRASASSIDKKTINTIGSNASSTGKLSKWLLFTSLNPNKSEKGGEDLAASGAFSGSSSGSSNAGWITLDSEKVDDFVVRYVVYLINKMIKDTDREAETKIGRKDKLPFCLFGAIHANAILKECHRYDDMMTAFLKDAHIEDFYRKRLEKALATFDDLIGAAFVTMDATLGGGNKEKIKDGVRQLHVQLDDLFKRTNDIKVEDKGLRVHLKERMTMHMVDAYAKMKEAALLRQFSKSGDKYFLYNREKLQSLIDLAFEGGQ